LNIFCAGNRNRLNKIISAVLLLLLLCICSCEQEKPLPVRPVTSKTVTILFFNDFHAHLTPFKKEYTDQNLWAGLARITAMVRKIRAENAAAGNETYLFSSGDSLQGSLISTVFKGEAEFKALDKLGIDAMAVGNHEFDFGSKRLLHLEQQVNFPLLSANTHLKESSNLVFDPYRIMRTSDGFRIAVMGLTTPETPITTAPENVSDYRFVQPELAVQRYIEDLDRRTDAIILLSHLGLDQDLMLARDYQELDVIIGGHTHTMMPEARILGEVIIGQAGDHGLYLGRMDIQISNDRAQLKHYEMIPMKPDMPQDGEMNAFIEQYSDKISSEYQHIVGYNAQLLDGERPNIRTHETNLGDLAADTIREFTGTDIAFINSGAIRASIHPGDVSIEKIINAFPMNNTICTMYLKGGDIYSILKRSIVGISGTGPDQELGSFLQVSGLSYKVKGSTISDVKIGSEPLLLPQTYHIATLDFLAAGGDGYKELHDGDQKYNTGVTLHDLVIAEFKNKRKIDVEAGNRIIRER